MVILRNSIWVWVKLLRMAIAVKSCFYFLIHSLSFFVFNYTCRYRSTTMIKTLLCYITTIIISFILGRRRSYAFVILPIFTKYFSSFQISLILMIKYSHRSEWLMIWKRLKFKIIALSVLILSLKGLSSSQINIFWVHVQYISSHMICINIIAINMNNAILIIRLERVLIAYIVWFIW